MDIDLEKILDFIKMYKKYLIVFLGVPIGALFLLNNFKDNSETKTLQIIDSSSVKMKSNVNKDKLFIDIKGEIKNPNVYEVDSNIRVYDLIKLAGGLTDNADTSQINLAAKIQNGQMIVIPNKNSQISNSQLGSKDNKVNINFATLEQLMEIPGIGESKAKLIIDYRNKNGSFTKIDDLSKISGFGQKTIEKLEEYIIV
jgi:competence protein ComEA